MFLPDPADVQAKAVELGLTQPGEPATGPARAQATKAILDTQTKPAATSKPGETELSRSVVKVADGLIVVTVTHIAS